QQRQFIIAGSVNKKMEDIRMISKIFNNFCHSYTQHYTTRIHGFRLFVILYGACVRRQILKMEQEYCMDNGIFCLAQTHLKNINIKTIMTALTVVNYLKE
ncbi:hypothetical protein ACJX0J_013570, partial [Zea mays]